MHTDTDPAQTPALFAQWLSHCLVPSLADTSHMMPRNLLLTPPCPRKFEARTEYSNLTQASVFGARCLGTTGKWGLGGGEAASDIPQPGLGRGCRCLWPFCERRQPSQAWPQIKCKCLVRQTLGWALGLAHSGPAVQSGWMSKEKPGKGGRALCPLHQL